jgi:hypothetical protein
MSTKNTTSKPAHRVAADWKVGLTALACLLSFGTLLGALAFDVTFGLALAAALGVLVAWLPVLGAFKVAEVALSERSPL